MGTKKINDQPICEHWGSLPHPVPWHCCCAYRPSEPLLAYVALKKSCPSTGVVWLVRFAGYTILAESQFKKTEGYAIVLGQYRTYCTLDESQSMRYLIESAAMRILKILKSLAIISNNSWSLSPWVVKDVKVLQYHRNFVDFHWEQDFELPGTSQHLHWCRASTLFEMPHKMGKHLAIDMLAQAPRVESSDTPAVLSGGALESGCSSSGQGRQSASSSGCLFHLQPASSQVTRA